MATNKHATIRYQALDRCFGNSGKKYFIEDLVESCNQAIYDYTGSSDGVKRRQIFDDIRFMESNQGWSIPLDRIKEGRRVYYRYSEKNFTITNKGISTNEANQLRETLTILSRFTGLPQFEWVREIQVRLEKTFRLVGDSHALISFDENPYLKGLNHFHSLYQALQNQQTLTIEYQGFRQSGPALIDFHPWHLKQYNNRWFLIGMSDELKVLSNLALDRIHSVELSKKKFIANTHYDFTDLFEDVVGVSFNPENTSQKIELRISKSTWPYIESKPIHGSQRVIRKTDEFVYVQLDLQLNHELNALLISYFDGVEVLNPPDLRRKFKEFTLAMYKLYN